MKPLPTLLLLVPLLGPGRGWAETLIEAVQPPQSLTQVTEVGAAEVAGVGPVRVTAQTLGTAITLWVRDAEGRLLGEGHAVTGLGASEVYLRTPSGLEPIRVRWPVAPRP